MASRSGVLLQVSSLRESLTSAQRSVAEYIVRHSEEVPFLSVHELARRAGVSVASVSRFARDIGYDSFKNFKHELGRESQVKWDNFFEGATAGNSEEELLQSVFRGNMRSLEGTLRVLDWKQLFEAARELARASRVVFFGIGSSGYVAQEAALRFSQVNIQAEGYFDAYHILVQAERIGESDIVFGISHSGRSKIIVNALETAKASGAKTVGLSNYLQTPLHNASCYFLCTSFPETKVRATGLSSRIAQFCLIDALYLLVLRCRDEKTTISTQLNEMVEKQLRV